MLTKIKVGKTNCFFKIAFVLVLCSYKYKAISQINFICPETDCSNGIDDDDDGYVDCLDLDCVLFEPRPAKPDKQRILDCYNLSEECVNYLAAFIANPDNDQWMQENLNVWEWGLSFMNQFGCTEEVGSYVLDALILKKADEEINLDRVEELYLTMIGDPYALVSGCPDFDLQTYQDLLNLQVPNSVINLLESYGICETYYYANLPPVTIPCFHIQTIEEGTSTLVNMDYYAVEITQLPDFDGNGISDNKEQIYQRFRDNFTSLVSGTTTITHPNCPSPLDEINASWTFKPYDINVDLPLWQDRTIGARFFIDADAEEILAQAVADDGAIVTIQENEFTFIVATIVTPISGTQPFAGKRMWGIRENQNGNLEIFTRAIDTALPLVVLRGLAMIPGYDDCDEADYFEIADRTWLNFQSQVGQFLNQGGGVGNIKTPQNPHLDFEEVYEKLKSNVPVNFVSCQ